MNSLTTLFCTEGSSDKEYRIQIVEVSPDLYRVVCFNGRRGGPLKEQPKTKSPVSLMDAKSVADGICREKMRKGYTLDESGVPYAMTERQGKVSGWLPQLPTPVRMEEIEALLADDDIVVQEKIDGERRAVEFGEGGLTGMNKKGLVVAVPGHWESVVALLGAGTLLDGEQVGETLWVFDALKIGGRDLALLSFESRWAELQKAMCHLPLDGPIRLVGAAFGAEAKRALVERIRMDNGEGMVFRNLGGVYRPGDSGSAAVVWKAKFQESCTAIVGSVHPTKNSVGLVLLDDDGSEVSVGNVTVPANQTSPVAGDLVEVRYLYRFENGCLFQPVLLGRRTDQSREDALLSKVTRIKVATPLAA